jgi:hypothetical protein
LSAGAQALSASLRSITNPSGHSLQLDGSTADPSHQYDFGLQDFVVPIAAGGELKQPPRDQRWPSAGAPSFSESPGAVDSAPVSARVPAQQPAPSAPSALASDPADFVVPALAILADETEAWQIRRNANVLPRNPR